VLNPANNQYEPLFISLFVGLHYNTISIKKVTLFCIPFPYGNYRCLAAFRFRRVAVRIRADARDQVARPRQCLKNRRPWVRSSNVPRAGAAMLSLRRSYLGLGGSEGVCCWGRLGAVFVFGGKATNAAHKKQAQKASFNERCLCCYGCDADAVCRAERGAIR
jgi:hypothetical protein